MTANQTSGFSLKDQLFNKEKVVYLAGLFDAAQIQFDSSGFVSDVMSGLHELELKQRIGHIASSLENHLSDDFRVAAKQITSALPPPLDPNQTDNDFGDFIFAPLGEYVARHGLSKNHLRLSLKTLKEITKRFSMEDSIRAFIDGFPDQTLSVLKKWATDSNYHVRRLVSEGTRPILPWSRRLSLEVDQPLPLLELLHADRTRYVTRSVANHLNDISKMDSKLVLKTLRRWNSQKQQSPAELRWMSTHALRTLVKQGNGDAMRLLGFRPRPRIEVHDFQIAPDEVERGQSIEWALSITAQRDEKLMIDFVIDFVKANGTTSPKVFKAKQIEIKKGQTTTIRKKHVFRDNATTFTLYPGTHALSVQINGLLVCRSVFELR